MVAGTYRISRSVRTDLLASMYDMHRVFQKLAPPPLKLFGLFSLWLSLFCVNFIDLQNFTQKDLTEVKIFQKVLRRLLF